MIGKQGANRRLFGKKTRVLHLKTCFFSVKTIFLPVNLQRIAGQRHVNWPLKAMIFKLKVVGYPTRSICDARKALAISDMRKSLILGVFVTSGEVVCKFAKYGEVGCQEKLQHGCSRVDKLRSSSVHKFTSLQVYKLLVL